MNNQHPIPYGLLYSVAPEHFAELHLSEDSFEEGFCWGESENEYENDYLASNVRGFLKELTGG